MAPVSVMIPSLAAHTDSTGNMTPQEELALRRQQLAKREGLPGYKANVEALKARIAELEAQINE